MANQGNKIVSQTQSSLDVYVIDFLYLLLIEHSWTMETHKVV